MESLPAVETTEAITITNPISGEELGRVAVTSAEGVLAAATRARAAQSEWAARPFRERAAVIKRFHDLLLRDKEELIAVLRAESGKSRRDAFIEVFAVSNEARYYAVHGGRFIRPHGARSVIPLRDRVRVHYHPYGVVGLIAAYNFPLVLTIGDAIPALLAGNGVLLKPSELVPLSAAWGRDKLIAAGLPADLLQIVNGGPETGRAVVESADFVLFTGSIEAGRAVARQAAARLIPFTVELGGKNALIVLEDANLRQAVNATLDGAFGNAGQICLCWERVYVHEAIYDRFRDRLVQEAARLRLGPGSDHHTDIGAIINARHVEKIDAHVQDALAKGATLLAGGKRRPDLGPTFYEPTILEGVTPGMRLYAEETFGPVIALHRFRDVEEAIRLANQSDTGLNFGVITRDLRRAEAIAARLEAGSVAINDSAYYTWGAMAAPLGGHKQSGIGRRHGPDGLRQFTWTQSIVINHSGELVRSFESALAMNQTLERLLTIGLRLWRHIPFIR